MQCAVSAWEGVLIMIEKLDVECWTLLALNGRHFGYVAEGDMFYINILIVKCCH